MFRPETPEANSSTCTYRTSPTRDSWRAPEPTVFTKLLRSVTRVCLSADTVDWVTGRCAGVQLSTGRGLQAPHVPRLPGGPRGRVLSDIGPCQQDEARRVQGRRHPRSCGSGPVLLHPPTPEAPRGAVTGEETRVTTALVVGGPYTRPRLRYCDPPSVSTQTPGKTNENKFYTRLNFK